MRRTCSGVIGDLLVAGAGRGGVFGLSASAMLSCALEKIRNCDVSGLDVAMMSRGSAYSATART